MYQLQNCFLQMGVFDLRFIGPQHSWTNRQPDNPISKKLDRFLVNSTALSTFPNALASFIPPLISDHTPCVLDLSFSLPIAGSCPYKFPNYLTKHPKFHQLIHDAWSQAGNMCQTLAQLCWKLKVIKSDMRALNIDNFSQIQERESVANRLHQCAQVEALQNPTTTTFQAERDLHQNWTFLRQIEEMYFRQKSRINWLREGDLNTTYFFQICQVRASYNCIRAFLTLSGDLITDPLEMSALAVSHFQSVLGPLHCPPSALLSPP